jgi:uncharacterized membrane protein YvbJ
MADKCPKCGGALKSSDKTCPKCGAAIGGNQATERIKTVSTAVMTVGAVLIVLDLLDVMKTYVGSLLVGIGFFIYYFYLRKKSQEDETAVEKKR